MTLYQAFAWPLVVHGEVERSSCINPSIKDKHCSEQNSRIWVNSLILTLQQIGTFFINRTRFEITRSNIAIRVSLFPRPTWLATFAPISSYFSKNQSLSWFKGGSYRMYSLPFTVHTEYTVLQTLTKIRYFRIMVSRSKSQTEIFKVQHYICKYQSSQVIKRWTDSVWKVTPGHIQSKWRV